MNTVATCPNPAEAMLIKTLLEGSGITAYVPGELTAQSAVNFAGEGIRVMVDAENVDAAKRILAEMEKPASGAVAGEPDLTSP
jgi:hypothetical protein